VVHKGLEVLDGIAALEEDEERLKIVLGQAFHHI